LRRLALIVPCFDCLGLSGVEGGGLEARISQIFRFA
jgi:hypothetical protein